MLGPKVALPSNPTQITNPYQSMPRDRLAAITDLADITDLSRDSIIDVLRARFRSSKVYVSIDYGDL